ncbi:MAG TPA: redoxin family protein [Planctomycetota bacterium]|nr:redoxin family protein [Planctomycetota bacterium]
MSVRFAVAALALALCAPSALAQQAKEAGASTAKLKPGDPAPALSIETWVKGQPVASFEKGKVYLVEFWATWCGPCIVQMPHLSQIQREHGPKGVTVIGVTSEDPRNSLEDVKEMVAAKGDGMGYTVAWDSGRKTNDAWMKAAGQGGIPCSFLVDGEGRIAYIGHPMLLDEPVEEVLAGTWDIEKGNAALEKAMSRVNEIYRASARDPKAALAKIAEFEKDHPRLGAVMDSMEFMLRLKIEDYDAAYALGSKLVDRAIAAKNPADLNQIAWTIVDPEGSVAKKDLELAMRAASKAVELAGEDAAILDTLARVYFLKGDRAKAIEIQERAVKAAEGSMRASLEEVLEEYRRANAQ